MLPDLLQQLHSRKHASQITTLFKRLITLPLLQLPVPPQVPTHHPLKFPCPSNLGPQEFVFHRRLSVLVFGQWISGGKVIISCWSCTHIIVFPIYIFITTLCCVDKAKNKGDLEPTIHRMDRDNTGWVLGLSSQDASCAFSMRKV